MRLNIAILVAVAALALGACSVAVGPPAVPSSPPTAAATAAATSAPTVAPTAPPTAPPTIVSTVAPTRVATAPPTAAPTIAPTPKPTAAPTPPKADVTIIAQSYTFTTIAVTAAAGKPFTLAFLNLDPDVGHNVHIVRPDGSDPIKYSLAGQGFDFVDGVASKVFQVPALKPGTYPFFCDAHPEMTGTLTVK